MKPHSPGTIGFVERMSRTLLDECFRVGGRQTWFDEPDEIHRKVDGYFACYIFGRTRKGYRLEGRTPAQALREALDIEELPPIVPAEEEAATPAA